MEVYVYLSAEQLTEVADDLINGRTTTLEAAFTDEGVETVLVTLVPDWMRPEAD